MVPFAELCAMSNFSLLEGGSHPEELVQTAHKLGLSALGIADYGTLTGVVRAHRAAKKCALSLRVGATLTLGQRDGHGLSVISYPTCRGGYGNICALLSKKNLAAHGAPLSWADLAAACQDQIFIVRPLQHQSFAAGVSHNQAAYWYDRLLKELVDNCFGMIHVSLALCRSYHYAERLYERVVVDAAERYRLPLLATADPLYHCPSRKPLHDILHCIRHHTTLSQAGYLLTQNAERYLKSPETIERLFADKPEAVRHSLRLAEQTAGFSLADLHYEYPAEICPAGTSPAQYLHSCVTQGAAERFPQGIPDAVHNMLKEELLLIAELHYEKYFLTCYDIVCFARRQGILCQGRGAAANSVVCYCLGITAVDPTKIDLLFARFISRERQEPPDIDIDFEHERREEVMQYLYERFGRDRAALLSSIITYRPRSAIRDVAKCFGYTPEAIRSLVRLMHHWRRESLGPGLMPSQQHLREAGFLATDPKLSLVFQLSNELLNFPRHLSQHVGGFLISESPISQSSPLRATGDPVRTLVEWNKDDVEELGMLKIDILALGMLSCIRRALASVNARRNFLGLSSLELHTIPAEDPAVYDMICAADTVGVFQIESRAQMAMLPRLKPRCFYDLVIEVAIVRPGPIQGNMVHPYLRRRAGLEKPHYPDAQVEQILGKTLGVPLFQEQAMRLSVVLAGFSPGEADELRRAMGTWKHNDDVIATFRDRIVLGMKAKGYSEEFALTCMDQIKGFSEYGFPESHAASFAHLVYASAWLKCHYPAEFTAALLNSQPMGFYSSAQLLRDAAEHGVEALPIDVSTSHWDTTLVYDSRQAKPQLRLGLRLVKGLLQADAELLVKSRPREVPWRDLADLWTRCRSPSQRLRLATLKVLADADAFQSLGLSRREAFWTIETLPPEPLPLDLPEHDDSVQRLPKSSLQGELFADYATTGFSLRGHPISLVRDRLHAQGIHQIQALRVQSRRLLRKTVLIAGLVVMRQRPPTAKGVAFLTLEDETGIANLIIRGEVFAQFQRLAIEAPFLVVTGILEGVTPQISVNVVALSRLSVP